MPVLIENEHASLRVDRRRLAAHLRDVLAAEGRAKARLEVTLVDDDTIRALNAEWRDVDAVTDVLSFALEEGEPMPGAEDVIGDVLVSLDTAARQASAMAAQLRAGGDDRGYDLFTEVAFLCTHGTLHLLGRDHVEPAEAEAMEARERQLMASLTAVDLHALDRSDHATVQG